MADMNAFGVISTGTVTAVSEPQKNKTSSLQAIAIAIPVVSIVLGLLSVFIVWRLNLIPYGSLIFKIFYMAMIAIMWPFYWLVMGIKWILFGYKPVVRNTLIM